MSEAPNVLDLFPAIGLRRGGRMPTMWERTEYWRRNRSTIIRAAVMAERWAYSHRQERWHSDGRPRILHHPTSIGRYGTAVLACKPGINEASRFGIRMGWNFKLRPGEGDLVQYHPLDGHKLCSEPDAVLDALNAQYSEIHGLALFSDNMQAEDVSGIFSNIQHPCSDCRGFLLTFLRQSSPIIVVRHALPCDLDPRAEIIDDPALGRLLVEDWTFGRICEYHHDRMGRR